MGSTISGSPVTLCPALPALASYTATVSWETYANGDYQLTTLQKEITLQIAPNAAGYVLDFRTAPPRQTSPADPEPLATMALRLATLYESVVVQATPSGEMAALLNHEAVLQNWGRLEQEMRAATTPDDEVTHTVLAFLQQQLQSPEFFLHSLQHDYLYQALAPGLYNQLLNPATPLVRARQFANFFDKTPLWFTEQIVVQPAETPAQVVLHVSGTLDAHRTNLTAVLALIEKALLLAPPPAGVPLPPTPLPVPTFHYKATYALDIHTGLPLHLMLTVYTRMGQFFNKEYTLSINRL